MCVCVRARVCVCVMESLYSMYRSERTTFRSWFFHVMGLQGLSSRQVCVASVLSTETPSLSTFHLMPLFLLSCPVVVFRTSSSMMNRSGEGGPATFVLDLRGTVSSLSPLHMVYASRVLGLKPCGTTAWLEYDFCHGFFIYHSVVSH